MRPIHLGRRRGRSGTGGDRRMSGGDPAAHAAAHTDAWPRVVDWFGAQL